MPELIIDTDGEYDFTSQNNGVVDVESTKVLVLSNVDGAVITIGEKYETSTGVDTFVAYDNGAITIGKLINHGVDTRLAVKVAGIGANPVRLSHSELFKILTPEYLITK